MTARDDQYLFLDELARRWRLDMDRIVELAIDGALPLWIGFTDVDLRRAEQPPGPGRKKAKLPAKTRYDRVEVRPAPEVLRQILGRCDRLLVVAELPCLDARGKPMTLTNSVGDDWGETSMVGLKPADLFARLDDIARFEQANAISHRAIHIEPQAQARPTSPAPLAAPGQDHPCFAPELHAAAACWQALFAQAAAPAATRGKAGILAWLQGHYPHLSQAARERIALVVTPAKNERRQTTRP
ncbi:MAG: hypothetical protein FWC49_06950 [Proteobacteria bacterium]|nr:hypothetical protein [Pseudomonadota bacterium]